MHTTALDILENRARAGSWWLDGSTLEMGWSDGIYRIHGLDPAGPVPTVKGALGFYVPESRRRLRAAIADAFEHDIELTQTLELERADGERRFVHVIGSIETRAEGRDVLQGAIFDVHRKILLQRRGELLDQRLADESVRWRIAGESVGLGIVDIDFDASTYRLTGPLADRLALGDERSGVLDYARWLDTIHPDDRRAYIASLDAHRAGNGAIQDLEFRLCLANAGELWVRQSGRFVCDGSGARLVGLLSDVSDRRRDQAQLQAAHQLVSVTFDAIGEGVVRVDRSGRITLANAAAESLLGAPGGFLIGRVFDDVFVLLEAEREVRVASPIARVFNHGRRVSLPLFSRLRRADGRDLSIMDSASPILDDDHNVEAVVFVFQDVTEARRMNDELVHQAHHDVLTGLPNRRGFEQALRRGWRQSGGATVSFLLYMDIDHFKVVNDTCGHAAGDELLRRIARQLQSSLRDSDFLARMGGDEFAAVVSVRHADAIEIVADKLVREIRELRFVFGGQTHRVSLSVGVTLLDRQPGATETALVHADAALYVAKQRGRGRFHVYGQQRDRSSPAASFVHSAHLLRSGLDEDRFRIYLQAIVDGGGQCVGYEALLRLAQADGAVVLPDVFLPTAKCLGMMSRIDRWMVNAALTLVDRWQRDGRWPPGRYLSINLSPAALTDPQFHDELLALLDRKGGAAAPVVFEITESDELSGEHYPALIGHLRARGFTVWLDDFAAGYNSFSMLKRVEVDGVKIDRVFVEDIERDVVNRAVIRSIAEISQTLGLDVVAEGIDNDNSLRTLIAAGFSRFQGYFFHAPEPAGEVLARHDAGVETGASGRGYRGIETHGKQRPVR